MEYNSVMVIVVYYQLQTLFTLLKIDHLYVADSWSPFKGAAMFLQKPRKDKRI